MQKYCSEEQVIQRIRPVLTRGRQQTSPNGMGNKMSILHLFFGST